MSTHRSEKSEIFMDVIVGSDSGVENICYCNFYMRVLYSPHHVPIPQIHVCASKSTVYMYAFYHRACTLSFEYLRPCTRNFNS